MLETTSGEILFDDVTSSQSINDLAWSSDGDAIASVSADCRLDVWDAHDLASKWAMQGEGGSDLRLSCVKWSHNSDLLVAGTGDFTIRVFDSARETETASFEGHTSVPMSVAFSRDDKLLFSKSADRTIRIWRTDNWSEICRLNESNAPFESQGIDTDHGHARLLAGHTQPPQQSARTRNVPTLSGVSEA